jgi:hypothetical protein
MTTIRKNGVEFTMVYIDPSVATAGTGESYDSPLKDFPTTIQDGKCYLVRRTSDDYFANMRVGNYSSIINLMIMGMPKSTDEEYELITDNAVKTAWGNDAYDYARIRWNFASAGNTTTYSFYVTNLVNFIASRCYFFRDSNSPSSQYYCQPMLYSNNTSAIAKFDINYCKFGYLNYELGDAEWRENNESFTDSTNKYGYNKCGNYFYLRGYDKFVMKNSIVDHIPTYMNSSYEQYQKVYGFLFDDSKGNSFKLINNVINKSYYNSTDTGNGYRSNTFNFEYQPRNITLLNNVFNEIMIGTRYNPRKFIHVEKQNTIDSSSTITNVSYSSNLVMKNNTINWLKMKNANPSSDYITDVGADNNTGSFAFKFMGLTSYDIDGLYVNGNIEGSEIAYERILNLRNLWNLFSGLGQKRIRNVKIKFCDDYSKCLNWMYGTRDVKSIYIADVPYIKSNDYAYQYSSSQWPCPGSATNIPLMENIDIDCPLGVALDITGINLKNANIKGRVLLRGKCSVDIDSFTNEYASSDAVYMDGSCNYLRIKDFKVNKESALYPYTGTSQITFNSSFGSNYFMGQSDIYVDKTNCPMMTETNMTANFGNTFRNYFISPNYGEEGQYVQYTKNGYMKSWNTVRQGSLSRASIKAHLSFGGERYGITLGDRPYKGIQITPSALGEKTLQLHFATKHIPNDDLLNKIWMAVEVPTTDDENIVFEDIYDSRSNGSITTETATWSNDSDLNTYVLSLPITVKRTDKPINIRINYEIFGDDTYTYLDPDIRLV